MTPSRDGESDSNLKIIAPSSDTLPELTPEEANLLNNTRRRRILKILSNEFEEDENAYPVSDLAEILASWENNKGLDEIERQEYKRAYVSLKQTHLPFLENSGHVKYCDNNMQVLELNKNISKYDKIISDNISEEELFPGVAEIRTKDKEWGTPELTLNEGLSLLGNERRQFTLQYLENNIDQPYCDLSRLTDYVVAWEEEIEVGSHFSDDRQSAYAGLRQFHLPKLHEKNIIDFDKRRGTIREDIYFEPLTNLLPDYSSVKE